MVSQGQVEGRVKKYTGRRYRRQEIERDIHFQGGLKSVSSVQQLASGYTNQRVIARLLIVRARSSDPDGDVAVTELFRVLLERRDDPSERRRNVSEVGNSSSDDEHLGEKP